MRARPPLRLAFLAAFGFVQPAFAADYHGQIPQGLTLDEGDHIVGDLFLAGDLTIPVGVTVLVTVPAVSIEATTVRIEGTLDASAVSNEAVRAGQDAHATDCPSSVASGGGGGNGGAGGAGRGGAQGGLASPSVTPGSPGGVGATCGSAGQPGGLGGGLVSFTTDSFTFGTSGSFTAQGADGTDGTDGGPVGAGGGGSGGALSIETHHLVINSTTTIDVRGGDGGWLPSDFGGGGGGGGSVFILYQTVNGAIPTPQIQGGTGNEDGFSGSSFILRNCMPDLDNDGFNTCHDCDDSDPSVHPGATESCNQIDDDCDDVVDNAPPHGDLDADGLTAHQESGLGTSDCNPDMDGDGLLDGDEQPGDTDNDGVPDVLDDDDDGDGLATALELHLQSNPLWIDSDQDGRPDCVEAGIPCDPSIVVHELPNPPVGPRGEYPLNNPDDDGDGIPSAWEFFTRHDATGAVINDGTCDTPGHPYPLPTWHEASMQYHYLCLDGTERFPSGTDLDFDGLPNHLDGDDDGDGLPTKLELATWLPIPWERDEDGDGVFDAHDAIDARQDDGDGLDRDEELRLCGTLNLSAEQCHALVNKPDADDDGVLDGAEELGDSDGDGMLDLFDDDDDDDHIPTLQEGDLDVDGDGIPNYLDDDSDGDGRPDREERTGDDDNDGIPNFVDADEAPPVLLVPERACRTGSAPVSLFSVFQRR